MLILSAAAETPSPPGAQSHSNEAGAAWGVSGSAPQTGSSAYTSGRAFRPPNGGPESAAPESQAEKAAPVAPAEQSAKAAEPLVWKIVIVIDKPTQEMKVFVDNVERYAWKVSTGRHGYDTPSGTYTARSMNEIWYSKQWDDAPMPHAIFFTKKGHAIHGTEETRKLGRPASHGCVRLAPENAGILFALVKQTGLDKTEIVLNGDTPNGVKVASPGSPKQAVKPARKTAKIVVNKPSSKTRLARSKPRKQPAAPKPQVAAKEQIKPSGRYFDPRFAPYGLGAPRGLSRRERLQFYYSGAPPGYYAPRSRAFMGY